MATLTLQGTGVTDTYIGSNAPTTNYSTSEFFYDGNLTSVPLTDRIIIKFDLSSIPVGQTINSAVMTFYYNGEHSTNGRVASVYRILQPMVITQATWNVYSTGNNWATAGCSNTTSDREATDISDGPSQPATPVEDNTLVFNLTTSKIKEITDGTFTNNGFLIQVATESNDLCGFKSTDNATTTKRPKLVIDYTEPAASGGAVGYSFFM